MQIGICWIVFIINGLGIKPHGIIGSHLHSKIFYAKNVLY